MIYILNEMVALNCLDKLTLSLDKGGSFSLFSVVISSVAPVALFNPVSGSK